MSVEKPKTVEIWLSNVKPSTAKPYLHFLNRFCQYAKTDPDSLVKNARFDSEAVHNTLKAYRRSLESQGIASYTLQLAYNAVRSFLTWNNVRLSKTPRAFIGRTRYESDRILQNHEVARMLSFAPTTRDKSLISMLCHGQRVGVLPALKYGHVRLELEKHMNPLVVEVKGELIDERGLNVNKSSTPYRFAIVQETSDFIRQMIKERVEAGEPIDDESWLFRNYSERVEGKLQRISANERGHALSRDAISQIVNEAAQKAGLQVKRAIGKTIAGQAKSKNEIHPHAFRRFWKRRMKDAKITDSELLDFMLGHELAYGSAYDKFDRETVRKEYARAEPFLTVMVNPEVQELQEEERLKSQLKDKNIDADNEFAKHPTWTRQDRKQWMEVMARQTVTKTSKSGPKKGQRMVIKPEQVDNHCNHGWRAVFQFQDGRVQVEYDGEE